MAIKLCLGTVQFGLKYGVQGAEKPNSPEAVNILQQAYQGGIRFFDTAAAYGTAEEVLCEFLRKEHLDDLEIVSKLRPNALNNCTKQEYASVIVKEVEVSLNRLGINQLYGYMFHNAGYLADSAAVSGLQGVKESGLAKHVGVSIYTPDEAMKALEYPCIDIIQLPYNALDMRLNQCGFFEKAKALGVTVFARSALLQGLLTMTEEKLPEKMEFAKPYLKRYWDICDKHSLTPYQAAVMYVLSNTNIDYLVFGVDNMEQLAPYLTLDCEQNDLLVEEISKAFVGIPERILMPNLW